MRDARDAIFRQAEKEKWRKRAFCFDRTRLTQTVGQQSDGRYYSQLSQQRSITQDVLQIPLKSIILAQLIRLKYPSRCSVTLLWRRRGPLLFVERVIPPRPHRNYQTMIHSNPTFHLVQLLFALQDHACCCYGQKAWCEHLSKCHETTSERVLYLRCFHSIHSRNLSISHFKTLDSFCFMNVWSSLWRGHHFPNTQHFHFHVGRVHGLLHFL